MQPWSQELRAAMHTYIRKRWYPKNHSQDQAGRTKVSVARCKFLPSAWYTGASKCSVLQLMPALHPRGSHQPAHCQWSFLAWHLIPLNLPAKLLHPRSSPQFTLPLYHPSSEGSATPGSNHDMGCIFNLDFNSSSFSCLYLPVPVPQGPRAHANLLLPPQLVPE